MKTSLLVAIAGCQMAAAPLFAAQEGTPYFSIWDRSSMPIVYYVNADDAAAWPEGVGAIIRSFMSWERIPGAYVRFEYAGTTDKKVAYNDGLNVVTWIKEGWPYGHDTVAYAVLWVSQDGESIVDVDVLLNEEDFMWATDGDPQAVDVQNVTTHEVGHALGLGHSVTSTDNTMFPVIVPGESKKRLIGEEERLIIRLIYPSGKTTLVTYAFSGGNPNFFAEKAVADYPSPPDAGRISLLTRVDVDGDPDGLDEIGIIQENDGLVGFYLFPAATSETPPSLPLAYDEWSIPRGDNLDLTAIDIDGDGAEEIGALRAESDGTYALYIYDAPVTYSFTEFDAPALVLKQTFRTAAADNLIAAVGLDYDGDGIDEVGVVRLTPGGQYFFDVFYITETGESEGPVNSVPLRSNLGFIDLDVLDVDGDEVPELLVLRKGSRGWRVSVLQAPNSNIPPEQQQLTLLATVPIALPAAHVPIRISGLRIAGPEGLPRPSICILMAESL